MLKIAETIELTIDSLAYGGEGVGRYENMPVFVCDTAPGDRIRAEITYVKKNYARAELKEILEPSKSRIKAICALSKVCGGCQWAHVNYDEQLRAKKKIVEDTVRKISGRDIPVHDVKRSDKTLEYRCKIQYPVGKTKISGRFLAGYYKKGTHEIVNIKFCPVHADIINKITEFLRTKFQENNLSAYNESKHKGLIRHVVFRYSSSSNDLLVIVVINSNTAPESLKKILTELNDNFQQISGVLINFNNIRSNTILANDIELVSGRDYIEESLEGKIYKISALSFFQINPPSAVKIFNIVRNIIGERTSKPAILDVYSGVGSFSVWLKDIASKITDIEESICAIEDSKYNLEVNKTDENVEIEIIEGNADRILHQLVSENRKFNVIILDPPRKGCSDIALDAISKLTEEYIIYVSCNPATLARDIRLLSERGFEAEYIQPVDMFCHTYHIESIALLKKV